MQLLRYRPMLASWAVLLSLCAAPALGGTVITISTADFDRWNYPFNITPGTRGNAPTFGAVGEGSFDNFDGQFLVGFNTTAAGVPALGPDEMYKINSVKVTATHSTGAFVYDPTPDSYASYLPPGDPDFVADTTAGRPVEIYGAGLRGGYSAFGFAGGITGPPFFNEGSPFAFGDPTDPSIRNAYAFDPDFGDVSNVVSDRLLTAAPWAVGQVAGLSPGDVVPQGTPGVSAGATFEFDIDLSRSVIHDYIAEGLENGGLLFTIASLHSTSEAGGANPNFYTHDNFDPAAIAPTLTIDFDIVPVPEPGTLSLGILGAAVLGMGLWKTRRSARQA